MVSSGVSSSDIAFPGICYFSFLITATSWKIVRVQQPLRSDTEIVPPLRKVSADVGLNPSGIANSKYSKCTKWIGQMYGLYHNVEPSAITCRRHFASTGLLDAMDYGTYIPKLNAALL